MNRIPVNVLLICAAVALCIRAAVPQNLQTEINRLDADESLKHGVWSLCVITADSGKIIASKNAEQSVIPASTMKVLTTGAALGLLGTDFRYETRIERDGFFDSLTGVVHGNLYIRGSGDPTIESKHFRSDKTAGLSWKSLPAQLLKLGIKKIDGDIIGDASCFSENPTPDGWSWGDLGQYYGAGTSGLSYHDNCVTLHFNSAKGDSCILERIEPAVDNVVYRSYVKADGKKDEAYVYGAPFSSVYYIYGSIPAQQKDYEVEAAKPEPAYQCAKDLRESLISAGISVSGKASTVRRRDIENISTPKKRRVLAAVLSPPLSRIVEETNMHSDNIYAEQLLRTLGLLKGAGGNTEDGITVVKNYWKSQGVDLGGLNMMDGSGLSRSNLVTTTIVASALRAISTTKWDDAFQRSLPVAGVSGSLAGMCKGTCAENNIRAKSGYINRARGYAGYVKTKSGKLLCFSLLANNYTCTSTEMKKKLEKVMVALAEMP
jgi:serine-type D-Ala-D-Ala carboxypeptidase/endopeptidase (penicillin-binding protein 4)